MKLILFQYPHLTMILGLPSSCFIHYMVLKAILSRKQTEPTSMRTEIFLALKNQLHGLPVQRLGYTVQLAFQ